MAHNLHTQSQSVCNGRLVRADEECDCWVDTKSEFLTLLLPFSLDAERWASQQFPRGHRYMGVHIFDKCEAEPLIKRMIDAGFAVYCDGMILPA